MSKLCVGCGNTFDGVACTYCGARHIIKSSTVDVTVRDVMIDSTKTYNNVDIMARLVARGYAAATSGRLSHQYICTGIGRLTRHLYTRGIHQARELRYHLAIPPELYVMALTIIESEKITGTSANGKNVIGRFIDTVWIDKHIVGDGPCNLPWFLLVHSEALTDESFIDEHYDLYYSSGTTP